MHEVRHVRDLVAIGGEYRLQCPQCIVYEGHCGPAGVATADERPMREQRSDSPGSSRAALGASRAALTEGTLNEVTKEMMVSPFASGPSGVSSPAHIVMVEGRATNRARYADSTCTNSGCLASFSAALLAESCMPSARRNQSHTPDPITLATFFISAACESKPPFFSFFFAFALSERAFSAAFDSQEEPLVVAPAELCLGSATAFRKGRQLLSEQRVKLEGGLNPTECRGSDVAVEREPPH
eukprot:scaffold61802_cov61-Phaeocystis_antarctica.AAC.3